MAKDLDTEVAAFRNRRLDQGPYTIVAADTLVLKVRESGRVARVHALVATGVNAEGYREVRTAGNREKLPHSTNNQPTPETKSDGQVADTVSSLCTASIPGEWSLF